MAQEAIDVTALGYEETNDSIPPHYRESVIRFLDGETNPDFKSKVETALRETRVNGSITLEELIRLNKRGDTGALTKLNQKKQVRPEPTGAPTVKLVFYSGAEIVYALYLGRYDLTGTHIQELVELVRKEGVDMSVDLGDFDALNQPVASEDVPENPIEE